MPNTTPNKNRNAGDPHNAGAGRKLMATMAQTRMGEIKADRPWRLATINPRKGTGNPAKSGAEIEDPDRLSAAAGHLRDQGKDRAETLSADCQKK
ncbi:hypothetical protein J2W92_000472 [Rhizobium leguminosarum]